ncbi:MAG: SUMF1/EgtB/PvdO family nonheme iron enzyme [bacterium]
MFSEKKLYKFILIILFLASNLYGNNINVSSVSLRDQNTTTRSMNIVFNVSWENSFKDDINWDAAWIFVKYKTGSGEWSHATLSSNSSDHSSPSGSLTDAAIDGKGVFIYRNANGAGNNNWSNVKLKWKYGTDGVGDNENLTVKVLGIEMVYIPQGSFYVGDGDTVITTRAQFSAHNTIDPFLITGEGQLTLGGTTPGNLGKHYRNQLFKDDFDSIVTQILPSTFSKGFNSFYCMKYEMTQEQYVDFLNSLTRVQQNTRTFTDISGTNITNRYVITNTSVINYRNGIRCDSILSSTGAITFYCDYNGNGIPSEIDDGQSIACGNLKWEDITAYLDWSCLSPLTELQYEKACRGPLTPIIYEFAWGTNVITTVSGILNSGAANEIYSNAGANCIVAVSVSSGPMRVGNFATTNSSREQSGATYYGVMEMSGNLSEMCISVGKSNGRLFDGSKGNGFLDSTGNSNVNTWPTSALGTLSGFGQHGGSSYTNQIISYISNRISSNSGNSSRSLHYGCRGVR